MYVLHFTLTQTQIHSLLGESTFLHLEAFRVFKLLDGSLETGSSKALNAPFPPPKKIPSNSLIYDILILYQSEEFVELC